METFIIDEFKDIRWKQRFEILKEEFNPIVIYLFGSAAKNKLRHDSDIDIAFLT